MMYSLIYNGNLYKTCKLVTSLALSLLLLPKSNIILCMCVYVYIYTYTLYIYICIHIYIIIYICIHIYTPYKYIYICVVCDHEYLGIQRGICKLNKMNINIANHQNPHKIGRANLHAASSQSRTPCPRAPAFEASDVDNVHGSFR